jgi:hypothetical protein
MQGKYTNPLKYAIAWGYRKALRARLRDLVRWEPARELTPGCTAVIGVCSSMPDVLLSNLTCLRDHSWPELREVIAVADTVPGGLDPDIEREAAAILGPIPLRLVYHSDHQHAVGRKLGLPYVYCWVSWCIGLGLCKTRVALLHDYDALILGDRLERRYHEFVESGAFIQGIRWYDTNGVIPEDRLTTTFETFLDVSWVRRYHPIRLFHDLGIVGGRSRDYDILLELQHNSTPPEKRTVSSMAEADLVHPSQMVHQYTMFRRQPGGPLPSFSIPMIPFFESLHAGPDPLERSIRQIRDRKPGSKTFAFLRDDLLVNFGSLSTGQVDWALKQMVRACVGRNLSPDPVLYAYGEELYGLADTPPDGVWRGDFTPEQRRWIERSRPMRRFEPLVGRSIRGLLEGAGS